MTAPTASQRADGHRCTYQPCRDFGRPVRVDHSFSCSHAERCPVLREEQRLLEEARLRASQAAPAARDWKGHLALAAAAIALLVLASTAGLWSRGPGPSTSGKASRVGEVAAHEYQREVDELVAFALQVLQKTHAVMIFEEEISAGGIDSADPTHGRWISASQKKKVERDESCRSLMEKLRHLVGQDQQLVDGILSEMRASPLRADTQAERMRVGSIRLAKESWMRLRQARALSSQELIANAERILDEQRAARRF